MICWTPSQNLEFWFELASSSLQMNWASSQNAAFGSWAGAQAALTRSLMALQIGLWLNLLPASAVTNCLADNRSNLHSPGHLLLYQGGVRAPNTLLSRPGVLANAQKLPPHLSGLAFGGLASLQGWVPRQGMPREQLEMAGAALPVRLGTAELHTQVLPQKKPSLKQPLPTPLTFIYSHWLINLLGEFWGLCSRIKNRIEISFSKRNVDM